MSTNIRLMRIGRKKAPYYRVVVAHSRNPRGGSYIENLGTYRPVEQQDQIKINVERYDSWIQKGAIATPIVKKIVAKVKRTL
ncbi:small subunit ribosomal protein S16 [Brevinema andersonii]|uniref:Small ribosomal subunit protein bS16 n=1 Tax=Brevinema andersonii TaxID=34097 RepID=A0A1I1D3Z0_BREAD|nr:30S ribosomal protein S16 [Brevinema andersonii]SFB67313.1 small subunit ribosomal protein S16 [Brevinema andersonii]